MTISTYDSIEAIAKSDWECLAPEDFPFADLRFLQALEATGCLGERTGWTPLYLIAKDAKDRTQGALLTYLKTNSYGEYIFDFAWANAYGQAGLDYYPKLVSAIPFTPATGPKLLTAGNLREKEKAATEDALLSAARELMRKFSLSSMHALFIPSREQSAFERNGFFIRHSYQYHWRNQGFHSFEDFLAKFRSKRRAEIQRERRQVAKSEVSISRLTGSELQPAHAELMYRFYLDTVNKRGGYDYLTKKFFRRVFETMPEKIMLVVATNREGDMVAGALNYFGTSTLFGRNWGCVEDYKALHFELCYYQGIEFAIEKKFELFEAGAQGEHKFRRGFLPALTYSAHDLAHEGFRKPIETFVEREKREIAQLLAAYELETPFSRESRA